MKIGFWRETYIAGNNHIMNDNDKNNLRGLLKNCFKETTVLLAKDWELFLPGFKKNLLDDILKLIKKKSKKILDIYNEEDIYWLILNKIAVFLKYSYYIILR